METTSFSRNNHFQRDDRASKNLDLFFARQLFNSCEATDELIKSIEESKDEAFAQKALTLYQQHYSTLERPWDHVTFMYGLGLIYMHFNAYHLAIKAFREAIYVQPSFPRSRDVHTRLGLIFKATHRYMLSEKHFNLAINDTRPNSGTSSRQELQFQLAHLLEVQGRFKEAKEAYEKLLQANDLPHQLSANIHRQLGWMCVYTNDNTTLDQPNHNNHQHHLHQQHGKLDTALDYLNTSFRSDSDPRTSYYIGRCFTNIGKFQDAFASYRSVIDREESTADTWCSIGVLYHRQNQPTDALQAYIRSVQFDKQHSAAWMNLGILYENHNQLNDALKCYRHVLRCNSNGDVDKSFQARVKYLEKQLADIDNTQSNSDKSRSSTDKLLNIEDLWNLESKTSLTSSGDVIQPKHVADNHINGLEDGCKSRVIKIESEIEKPKIPSSSRSPPGSPSGLSKAEINSSQVLSNGAGSKDSGFSSNSSTCAESTLIPSQNSTDDDIQYTKNHYHCAQRVIEAYRNSSSRVKKIDVNLLKDNQQPPNDFPEVPPYPPLPSEQLFPSPPSIFLDSKKDLVTRKVQELCQTSPISIVRNFASVLKLDLGLFSTRALVETNPDYPVDISSHLSGPATGSSSASSIPGTDFSTKNDHRSEEQQLDDQAKRWTCPTHRSSSTISHYASYQVASFRESMRIELETKPMASSSSKSNPAKESETDSNGSNSTQSKRANSVSTNNNNINSMSNQYTIDQNHCVNPIKGSPATKKLRREAPRVRRVKFAERIDLSDETRWRMQLNELNKMPNFIKCISASNMLTHMGSTHPGVNTTMMSMHVPGCRMLGNRAPNNFCHININVGPGDYEWHAISAEYGTTLSRLCNKYGFELDDKGWWPKISDLQKHNVPVYRFSQRPGDVVWVNSGTVYWTQAIGWCNNIHWNIGPLCARQFRSASESSELNKLLFRKSDVPMVQLTWNMIMNINYVMDDELNDHLIDVMRRSLRYCLLVGEIVEEAKSKIHVSEEDPGPRVAKYCSLCESEVFNIQFVPKNKDGGDKTHCIECSRRSDSSLKEYEIKQDYSLDYLMSLYDKFMQTKRKFESRRLKVEQ